VLVDGEIKIHSMQYIELQFNKPRLSNVFWKLNSASRAAEFCTNVYVPPPAEGS
jgi:hypothetical protein